MPILDADIFSQEALQPNKDATREVINRYGDSVIQKDKTTLSINRKELGEIIFTNEAERKWLESLLHPIIENRFIEELNNKKDVPTIILVIPLLFEANLSYLCKEIWLVYCKTNQQYQRLMNRENLTFDQAKCRIESQLSISRKLDLSDKIINNSNNLCEAIKEIDKLL